MENNDPGTQEPLTPEVDQTTENNDESDFDVSSLDEDAQKKFKGLDAQRKHWREKATDPESGKTYQELLNESKVVEESPETKKSSKSELDYGQKAYLRAEGVKSGDEQALVEATMKESGKELEDILESKYFQSELKELRDAKKVAEAIPSGTKRSGNSARDEVSYWVKKGELPPSDQVQLRRDVVNARIKTAKTKNQFSDHPVVS